MSEPAAAERFEFAFATAYRLAGLAFGITPQTAHAELSAAMLAVRFGPWRVQTPLSNIAEAELTGPYAFVKTAGPARLAITDRGLTFATNGERGVRLGFHGAVRGIEPSGLLRHPELTITLAEPTRFRARLGALAPSVARAGVRGW